MNPIAVGHEPIFITRTEVGGSSAVRSFQPASNHFTERRHHVGGVLGRAITARLLELDWMARHASSRALRLTEAGRIEMPRTFGLKL